MNFSELKAPPHSVESEQATLAAILEDNRAFHQVNGLINSDDFFRAHHQVIFRRMEAMAAKSQPLDAVSLIEALDQSGELEQAGGVDYLADLATAGRGSANVTHYALTIRDKRILRQLINISHDIANIGHEPGELQDKIDAAQRLVMSLEVRKSNDPRHIANVLESSIDLYEAASKAKGGIVGMPTGFTDLDKRMGGMMPDDMIVVAGRPSMGKSVFAMNLAETAAMDGKVVLVFSLEMSAEQLAMRSMASVGRVDYSSIKSGDTHQSVITPMSNGITKLKDTTMYIDDSANLTSQQLASRARKLSQKIGKPIDLIVLDYLQLLSDRGDGVERITKMSRAMKLAAKDLKCPIVCLSQLNRGVENRPDKRPLMSDLRESGAIEQDADAILMLYRDEVYRPDTPEKGIAQVLVRKLRNGEIGTVYLKANLHHMRFDDLAQEYQPQEYKPAPKKSAFSYLDE